MDVLYEAGFKDGYQQAMKEIMEIVRCKDCKYYLDMFCPMFDGETDYVEDPNWFCGDGERRVNKNE